MKLTLIIFLLVLVFTSCTKDSKTSLDSYDALKDSFINPPQSAKPKVYWWCLNGKIDTVRAKQELQAMKNAGIGGFDLFEIGAPKNENTIPAGPAFLSDESVEIIKWVVEEAGRLGLDMGLNLASSWNAGGSWILPRHGAKSLYRSQKTITGDGRVQAIEIPFPEINFPAQHIIGHAGKPMIPFGKDGRPKYYEEVALLALPTGFELFKLDTSKIINLTPFFDTEKSLLEWKAPPGDWTIQRFVCSNSGQTLVLPSPYSAGLTIDHFDSSAVEFHLNYIINRLKPALGELNNAALKSFYLASYEARGFVWTSSMTSVFRDLHGYDITKYLPLFFNDKLYPGETKKRIDTDFKKTLSELMINNLYKKSREICHEHGLKINCEAGGPGFPLYNGPAEPLKALGNLDIPRGEFWINHARWYDDEKTGDSIDILRVVKEVAAASHIYEKGIVEEEAFTSFQHWQEGPGDMKPFGDRAFCEGMNRVVFHGFSHNPAAVGFPGYVYLAGTHFNDKRVWWPKAKPFIEYLSRISAVFQEANFFADVIWYYGDKVPNSATPKNTHFRVGAGYDYEVINTEILLSKLSSKNGKLTLPYGVEFSVLALEHEEEINPKVLLKLSKLADQGAVIVGERPSAISHIKNSPLTQDEGKQLIYELWDNGKIRSGISVSEEIDKLNIEPDFRYTEKEEFVIDYIHYQKDNIDLYFIANTTDEWISNEYTFRQSDKVPELWDPVSGEIITGPHFEREDKYIKIPLRLAPYESQLVVFRDGPASSLLESKLPQENIVAEQTLRGPWLVKFPETLGAPPEITLAELSSWTDSELEGVKYFSGTATYKSSFQLDHQIAASQKVYLDLGEVSKVAEVWLNGEHLGISWTLPHKFDITNSIKNSLNVLVVEVANTWSNRLVGDAVSGENFTHTNVKNTIVPVQGMEPGDQTRVAWKDVPLIDSGILGPVKIQIIGASK